MGSVYWVNGKPMRWTTLIELAEEKGCKWMDDTFRSTEEATGFLRGLGYNVSETAKGSEG